MNGENQVGKIDTEFIQKHAQLTKDQLNAVLSNVKEILDREDKLVKIPCGRIYILGDTHGDINLTIHALKHVIPSENPEEHTHFDKLVFLGDFIDSGRYVIQNINLLMSMKALYPEKIILIRGNHETRKINMQFDFYEQVLRKYGMKIFEKYNKIFAKLPLAIITWNNIFAIHGGIPQGLENINQLNGLEDCTDPEDKLIFQLLWNDPVEREGWFFKNFRGKYSKKFGKDAFEHFREQNKIDIVVRAHEHQKGGFKEYFDAKLISLDTMDTKLFKSTHKVLIIEESGDYKVRQVEHYNKKYAQHLFY